MTVGVRSGGRFHPRRCSGRAGGWQIEAHALDGRAYRPAQVAGTGTTVRSVLLPDLSVDAGRVFSFPWESAL